MIFSCGFLSWTYADMLSRETFTSYTMCKTNWLPFLWDKIFMDEVQVWLKCFIDQWNSNIYRHFLRNTSTSKTMPKSSWLPLRFQTRKFKFAWNVSLICETQMRKCLYLQHSGLLELFHILLKHKKWIDSCSFWHKLIMF